MELVDYLRVLRRRWWMVLLAVITCATGSWLFTQAQTPMYTTTTRLLVSGIQTDDNQTYDEVSRRQLAADRAGAYAQLAGTGPAVAAALDAAGAHGVNPRVVATADGASPFIVITVTASSGRAAQSVANSYVDVLPRIVNRLEQAPNVRPPTLTPLETAALPTVPSSPNPRRNLLIGLALGLVLGLSSALVRESLDARVRESAEIEKLTGATLLGVVPKEHNGESLPARTKPHSRRAEAYRAVRTTLEFSGAEGMPRSLVVTSASPGDGKSSLACNLALVAARAGRSVVVVDADLRKPMVASYFGIQSPLGLTEVLSGRWSVDDALQGLPGERLAVLTSGAIPSIPSELVGSAAMADLIRGLEQRFDLVVIDSPPVLPVSDALLVGVHTGGIVVVVRMAETTRAAMRRALDAVRKVNATLLGVVANAAGTEEKAYGYGYGYAPAADDQAIDLNALEVRPAAMRGQAPIVLPPGERVVMPPTPEPRPSQQGPRRRRLRADRPAATATSAHPHQPDPYQVQPHVSPRQPGPRGGEDTFDDILRPWG